MLTQQFTEALLKLYPIIALIILGLILQKYSFFKEDGPAVLKKIIINIALPALLYGAFYQVTPEPKLLIIVLVVLITCVLMIFIGQLLARILRIQSKYFALLFGGFETGMLGYAIFSVVFDPENLHYLAVVDLGQVIFVFFILATLITGLGGGFLSPVRQLKTFATSPVIIAIFLGVITSIVNNYSSFTGSSLFISFYQLLALLGSMTVPLICLVIGYELKINTRSIALPLKTILIRMLLLFFFAMLINKYVITELLHLNAMYSHALMIMFLLPPPFVIPIFMKESEAEEKQYVLNSLSLGTICSLIAIALVVILYF